MSSKKYAGLVSCSNGLDPSFEHQYMSVLMKLLSDIGITAIAGKYLYKTNDVFGGTGKERADDLMAFFNNKEIDYIFDLSGGDIANETLRYLNFDQISKSKATFVGYSDLTTILNAIYTKTGKEGILYQVRNVLYKHGETQIKNVKGSLVDGNKDIYKFPYQFIQGNHMEGTLVGGNIRCFLKLAGTEYFPDLNDKILFLEAMSGRPAQITTYLSQLWQLGAFHKIKGLILGSYTQMEREELTPTVTDLLRDYVDENLPVAKTYYVGHGSDSMALRIGSYLKLNNDKMIFDEL